MRSVNYYLYHSQCWLFGTSPVSISTVFSWQALLFAEAFRTLSLSQVQNASIYYLAIQQERPTCETTKLGKVQKARN